MHPIQRLGITEEVNRTKEREEMEQPRQSATMATAAVEVWWAQTQTAAAALHNPSHPLPIQRPLHIPRHFIHQCQYRIFHWLVVAVMWLFPPLNWPRMHRGNF
jgi:hypothetical protein